MKKLFKLGLTAFLLTGCSFIPQSQKTEESSLSQKEYSSVQEQTVADWIIAVRNQDYAQEEKCLAVEENERFLPEIDTIKSMYSSVAMYNGLSPLQKGNFESLISTLINLEFKAVVQDFEITGEDTEGSVCHVETMINGLLPEIASGAIVDVATLANVKNFNTRNVDQIKEQLQNTFKMFPATETAVTFTLQEQGGKWKITEIPDFFLRTFTSITQLTSLIDIGESGSVMYIMDEWVNEVQNGYIKQAERFLADDYQPDEAIIEKIKEIQFTSGEFNPSEPDKMLKSSIDGDKAIFTFTEQNGEKRISMIEIEQD